ncbi:unnamed protein product [Rhodiola kirilowii]
MIPESAKGIWYEEFMSIATWDAGADSHIRSNFMRRCNMIVNDEMRMRRTSRRNSRFRN